ncbi:hypothetical protein Leryth_025415 [Lithospermum erythrorhizon]|nr:hypothetical protein Leryth_025415 [Lithospermum erythrorhizon]
MMMSSLKIKQKSIIKLLFSMISIILLSDTILAKSRIPISDAEIRLKKQQCYEDIESGLWGQQCKTTTIEKENCALRCLSPACYELIYMSDPLEEGEKDYLRSQEYKYCMNRESLGESLDVVRGSFGN